MKLKGNQKGRRYMATFLAILLVWSLIPGNSFALSVAARTISGNAATPSDATEAAELNAEELDESTNGESADNLASPSDVEKDDTYITENDAETDAVQDMIASIPSVKEYKRLTAEEQREVLQLVQEAMDAYNDLTKEQQKGIVGEEIFTLYEKLLTATPSNAVRAAAFEQSKTIDGITVRVTADKGVFPEDAVLHVELVEDTQLQEQIQTAVEETFGKKDDPKKTVEKTMAFDITILDSEGNELQPDTEQGQVKVSFEKVDTANVEAGKSTLEVFHFNEDNTQAEKLDAEVDVDAKTVEVQAEHFSVYVLGEVAPQADGDVAKVTTSDGGTTTCHATFAEAVTAANAASGSTLTLLKDIGTSALPLSMTEQLEVTGNFTLDLAGNTIYYTRNPAQGAQDFTYFMNVTGSLTIDNGTGDNVGGISGDSSILCLMDNCTTKITGGNYQASLSSYTIQYTTSATLYISGGVFGKQIRVPTNSNNTVNITGGSFTTGLVLQRSFTEVIPEGYMMYKTSGDSMVDLSLKRTDDSVYVQAVTGDTPYIREQPKTSLASVYEGYTEAPVLSMKAIQPGDGATPLNYQWYQKGSEKDTKLGGATETSYTLPLGLPAGTYTYYCVVSGNNVTLTSNSVTVTVKEAAVIVKKDDGTISYYDEVSQAISKCTNSTYTVTLNKDIETLLNYRQIIILSNITLDLNGYKWSITIEGSDFAIAMYNSDYNLIITDSSLSGSGSVNLNNNISMFNYVGNLYGTVQLSGGTYNRLNVRTSKSILAEGYGYYVNNELQTITADTELTNVTVRKPYDPNLNLSVVANPKDATLAYDGTAKNISVAKGDNFTWNTDATISVEGYYTKNGEVYTKTTITDGSGATAEGGAPVKAGTYYVRVVVAGDSSYAATVSDYMGFEIIEKKPAQINDIYQISTAEELMWFAAHVNDASDTTSQSANAALTEDLSLDNTFPRIGIATHPYTGTFDGGGHTVTVNYTDIDHQFVGGLFDYVGSTTIKNLTVTGRISTSSTHAGGVVSYAKGSSATVTFENVFSSVDITSTALGDNTSGGIASCLDGITTMTNCAYTGTISNLSGTNCGGLLGYSDKGVTFENCYMAGTMTLFSNSGSATFSRGNSVTCTNCYYLNGYGTTAQGTAKTADEFASGAVAYLLNGSTSTAAEGETLAWYQNVDAGSKDDYPVLDDSHGVVYKSGEAYTNINPDAPTVNSVQGHSLTLDGTIGVNFYVEFAGDVLANPSNYYVEVTNARGTSYNKVEVTNMIAEKPTAVKDSNEVIHNCYKVSGSAVAKEMADDLTMKLMQTGNSTPVMSDSYSVKRYIANATSKGETLTELTTAMALYGAYSQTYFNYHTDDLVMEATGVDDVTIDDTYKYTLSTTDHSPVQYYGSNLYLESITTLCHYFELEAGSSITDFTFMVGDQVVTPKKKAGYASLYYVEFNNIAAQDLEVPVERVTVSKDGVELISLSGYSPLTYLKVMIEGSMETFKPVAKAMYWYWKKADEYFKLEG